MPDESWSMLANFYRQNEDIFYNEQHWVFGFKAQVKWYFELFV